jgi:hypothetical protein
MSTPKKSTSDEFRDHFYSDAEESTRMIMMDGARGKYTSMQTLRALLKRAFMEGALRQYNNPFTPSEKRERKLTKWAIQRRFEEVLNEFEP